MPVVVSFINLKGGVGKTTLAVNFAAYCGLLGRKVLLIDLDPQTNATIATIGIDRWEEHSKKYGTVANLLEARNHLNAEGKKLNAEDIVVKDVFKNVDLIPSHMDLFTIDLELAGVTAREKKLKLATKELLPKYDIVVCDCPPNLTIPTQNAIAISTHYVVPTSPDFLSAIGIGLLIKRILRLSSELEHNIKNAGIVVTRYGRTSNSREQTIESLKEQFKELIILPPIKDRTKVADAAAKNASVFDMGDSEAEKEFTEVCKQILVRIESEK